MIWIQENKGLAAFLGLCFVGCAALGVMLFGSYKGYGAAFIQFEASRKAVGALENKPLYPDDTSIQLKKDAVDAYAKAVSEFREKLTTYQRPLDLALTGNEFQKRLTDQVERIRGLAAQKKVKLPEEFRVNFERWVNSPAPQAAVAKLDFQLEAISDLVTVAIESGISSVESVVRKELPEESGSAPVEEKVPAKTPAKGPAKAPVGVVTVPALVERYPVEITFKTSHKGLENVLNTLSNASATPQHYFIVRLLEIRNDAPEGPLKEDTFAPQPIYAEQGTGTPVTPPPPVDPGAAVVPDGGAAVAPGGAAPPAGTPSPLDPGLPVDPAPAFPPPTFGAGTPTAYTDARVLLGEEQLTVYLQVEVVRFKPEVKEDESGAVGAAPK